MEENQVEVHAKPRVIIRPDTSQMVKTASGSFHKNDFVGNTLTGLSVDQVCEIASEFGLDPLKYAHLNRGQVRMALGNALRKLVPDDGDDAVTLEKMADGFRAANEAAVAEKAEAKEAAKAEKAEAKAAEKALKAANKAAAKVAETDDE